MAGSRGSRNRVVVLAVTAGLVCAAGTVEADFTFGTPVNLGPVVNSTANEAGITLSSDGLELYFGSQRSGGQGDYDIWISTRQSVEDAWGPPVNLGSPVNSPYVELYPCLSSDDLTLYFSDYYSGSPRPGGLGGGDIWMTTRTSRDAPWTTPVNLGAPVNSADLDMSPTVSADGLTLIFNSRNRAGGLGSWDVWMSARPSVHDPWGEPVNLGSAVNSGSWEGEAGLSADGRALVFGSGRPGIVGGIDLWMTMRKDPSDSWTPAVNAGAVVNSSRDDGTARFSPDMTTLYFCSDRPDSLGGYDLYAAPILPMVDFNGDGMVALEDLVRLIESWGNSDLSVDVGPGPWGDGTVDVADLEMLMRFWQRQVDDPTLLARWALDEADGTVAADSVAENDGTVTGDATWRAQSGRVDGAIELDGIDDSILADLVLDPDNGSFSILAWIKGGAPGQVIVSQADAKVGRLNYPGCSWLGINAVGALTTDLVSSESTSSTSEVIITDGQWHRVALAWDKASKTSTLHVDGVEVAAHVNPTRPTTYGGLQIGVGRSGETDSFFTGLIDDVRIYNRAVKP